MRSVPSTLTTALTTALATAIHFRTNRRSRATVDAEETAGSTARVVAGGGMRWEALAALAALVALVALVALAALVALVALVVPQVIRGVIQVIYLDLSTPPRLSHGGRTPERRPPQLVQAVHPRQAGPVVIVSSRLRIDHRCMEGRH